MMKKKLCAILATIICLSFCTPAMATEVNSPITDNCIVISREEYLQNYADYYDITYEEALAIDRRENAEIWADYFARNNIPVPYTITYDGYYEQGDAKIYYVTVSNVADGVLVDVTYSAFGKMTIDRQGRTFVPDSFKVVHASTNNAFFSLQDYVVIAGDDSYTRLTLILDCTVEIEVSLAPSAGFEVLDLIDAGFALEGSIYYRKSIHDSFTETP